MPLFELSSTAITGLDRADFSTLGILERGDLQRLLRDHVGVIAPETLVISEEFSSWDRSGRRIDLLGVDRQGRLVVIELKRTADDSLADLQAVRYAAMVSQMTFEEAVETYRAYLAQRGLDHDARAHLLEFLDWTDPSEGRFAEDVRIVLAAADFSAEVTSTVLWMNERDLDITCVRLQPYRLGEAVLLDVQQIVPLPEAADYQIQIRQKHREVRAAAGRSVDWTRYDVQLGADLQRSLSKRDVVFATTRFLVSQGVAPEEIETTAGRRMFEAVDGHVEGDVFRAELIRRRPNDARALQRYYSRDEQLFRTGGKTYAVTTQWSKTTMEAAMAALVAQYAAHGLSYRETVAAGSGV